MEKQVVIPKKRESKGEERPCLQVVCLLAGGPHLGPTHGR